MVVVIEEEEEKARVSEDGGLELSKIEQKYPGEIISTFEKDEWVWKANNSEGLEKWLTQSLKELNIERKIIFQGAHVVYLCLCI